jgi:hypothetical protein
LIKEVNGKLSRATWKGQYYYQSVATQAYNILRVGITSADKQSFIDRKGLNRVKYTFVTTKGQSYILTCPPTGYEGAYDIQPVKASKLVLKQSRYPGVHGQKF